ncbi:MAG: glycosyltransferase [Dactylosporangium sp.]|nr:glycosyltransferase [Dactylosporangium sp.]NNJ63443.1 glycosyltransferase [Dactylosporangium sp.]
MSRHPVVSVVLCTYARPHGLAAALDSVCAQRIDSVEAVEAVVVNGGGPDVAAVVAGYRDRLSVRLLTLPTNEGLGHPQGWDRRRLRRACGVPRRR